MHQNEEFDHHGHRAAPFVTAQLFSLFEYLERYPACFDAGRFCQVRPDGNELQVWDCLGNRRDSAVAGRTKR